MYKTKKRVGGVISTIFKIAIIVLFVFPFVWMLSISFQTTEEILKVPATFVPASPQFQNFIDAWNAGPFPTYVRNSLVVITSIIVLQLIVMVPAAYGFAKYDFAGKNLMFGMVLIAFMTPTQLTFLPIYQLMSKWGLMKTLYPQILPFITNAFGIFLLRQYFMQVPDELIEAARLDSASELKIVYRLMLPMSKPAIATVFLFSFVNHWNEYFWPLVMTNSTAVRPLTVGVAMLKNVEGMVNWNIIMAGNMILVFPILLVYILASKNIIKAFAYSGIK